VPEMRIRSRHNKDKYFLNNISATTTTTTITMNTMMIVTATTTTVDRHLTALKEH